jgi:hypothetical protein
MAVDITKLKARNMRTKKDEIMKDPSGVKFKARGDQYRYMVCGFGSDGTKMCKIVNETDAKDLEAQGLKFTIKAKK